jgi:peptidylprolyl isomerase/peptidyl-prolyl cis-trans isomerase B (cyclophilin B)
MGVWEYTKEDEMSFKSTFLTLTIVLFSATAFADKVPDIKDPVEDASKVVAVLETPKGELAFEFFPKEAPGTVKNFITLTQKGFYNGLTFHRVVPGFVIQGGDPKGNGTGGPGYTIKAEFNSRKHLTGTVAMARAQDPNSAGSQFYICLASQPSLDGNYTVFGQLIKGYEVIKKIQVGDVMKKVSLKDKEKYAKGTKLEVSPDLQKSESKKEEK